MKKMKYSGIGIHMKVADIEKSRHFYEDILDLVPAFGYGDNVFRNSLPKDIPSVGGDGLPGAPEKYKGVVYEPTPQSPFEIAEGHIAVPDRSVFLTPVQGPKVSAMLRVNSVLPIVRDKGVKPTFPIRHYYWGTIELALKDPDGFVVVLISPYSDAEAEALSAFVKIETVSAGA